MADDRGGGWLGVAPSRYGCADFIDRLHEIKALTLIVVGELDVPFIHCVADRYAAGIDGSRKIIIPHAGHMSNMDDPGTFNRVTLEFLARAEAR